MAVLPLRRKRRNCLQTKPLPCCNTPQFGCVCLLTSACANTILRLISPLGLSIQGTFAIRRPMRPVAPQKDGPLSNEDITSADVQLIDAEGENRGIVNTRAAMAEAQELGLDLV